MIYDIKLITEGYGWQPVHSGNDYSLSFKRDAFRINVYYTSQTILLQGPSMSKSFRKVAPEALEDILITIEEMIK